MLSYRQWLIPDALPERVKDFYQFFGWGVCSLYQPRPPGDYTGTSGQLLYEFVYCCAD
ncbi:MAG: hypothetical protein P8M25_02420 [Paracoccaceae bacterium]|nr:hypothetical protein [Paracoccaceae bacterium]